MFLRCQALSVFFLLPLLQACSSEPSPLKQHRHVAHAGGMIKHKTYTNSLEALQASYARGFRLFELDINWTQDGHLVLIHDWEGTWQRLYNKQETPSLQEFKTAKMVDRLTGLTFPRAASWLESHPDAYFITDVKVNNIPALKEIARSTVRNQIIPQIYEISEFSEASRLAFPFLIFSVYRSKSPPQDIIDFARNSSIDAITAPLYQIQRGDYDPLIGTDTLLFVHTVNEIDMWCALERKGVDGLYTDIIIANPCQ